MSTPELRTSSLVEPSWFKLVVYRWGLDLAFWKVQGLLSGFFHLVLQRMM